MVGRWSRDGMVQDLALTVVDEESLNQLHKHLKTKPQQNKLDSTTILP